MFLICLDSYLIARELAKKAEYISDLSTNESSLENHDSESLPTSVKQFVKRKDNDKNTLLWSPNDDILCKLFYILAK